MFTFLIHYKLAAGLLQSSQFWSFQQWQWVSTPAPIPLLISAFITRAGKDICYFWKLFPLSSIARVSCCPVILSSTLCVQGEGRKRGADTFLQSTSFSFLYLAACSDPTALTEREAAVIYTDWAKKPPVDGIKYSSGKERKAVMNARCSMTAIGAKHYQQLLTCELQWTFYFHQCNPKVAFFTE